jgi:hypothetical protein
MLVAPSSGVPTRPIADYLWADGSLNSERLVRHLKDYKAGRVPHDFQPHVGMPVVMEEEFIGRAQVLAELEGHIERKQSCHLRAPRRYGKSSLMGRLAAKLDKAVMLELSDIGTLQGFLKTLLRSCMRHNVASACLGELDEYRSWPVAASHATSSQVFNQAFAELMGRNRTTDLLPLLRDTMRVLAEGEIVLLVDEFSIFLRDMHDSKAVDLPSFLDMFHRLRCRGERPLVSVFAGSAGLSTYIELYGMSNFFGDLSPIDVTPISAVEARLLAEELFYGMKKQPTVSGLDRLVALTGGDDAVPYFVQALASYTAELTGRKREISADTVELAYYDRLLGPAGNLCFRDFILRERAYPDIYRSCASQILKQLARSAPDPVTEGELRNKCKDGCYFAKIMTCLEEDYDLVRLAGGWRMRSSVIADRWRLGEPWLTIGGK